MSTQHISETARIGAGTTLGHFVVIEEEVVIGQNCEIGHHVVLKKGTRIADSVRIGDHSLVGKQPAKASNSAMTDSTPLESTTLGEGCQIGAFAIIYAGASLSQDVFVADLVTIREQVSVGEKTIVGRGVAIENRCQIGSFCKLETNAYITAHSSIGNRVFVAPGVLTSNDNFIGRTQERFDHFKGATLEDGARLGVGAVLLPGVTIAREAVVAAGAVQTKDAKAATIHVGIPAKPIRPVPDEQLLSSEK